MIGFSQHEWINPGQAYYKISTETDGVYRLSYTTLSASGVDMDAVDPRDIRVYHRGHEVAVHVEGQEDGSFDSQDYVEFVGKRNDGQPDEPLYQEPEHMANPYFNTHSDATAFFLTITPGIRGKRMFVRNPYSGSVPSLQQYKTSELKVFSDQYSLGKVYPPGIWSGAYDRGQGWTGRVITRGNISDVNFSDLGNVVASENISLNIGLVGRSNAPHVARISVGPNSENLRNLGDFSFNDFEFNQVNLILLASDFSGDGRLTIRIAPIGQEGSSDNISCSYVVLEYTKTKVSGDFEQEYLLPAPGESNLTFENTTENYVGYDIADFQNVVKLSPSQSGNEMTFPAGILQSGSKLRIQKAESIIEPHILEKVKFRDILNQPADFIILTHESLRQATSLNTDPVAAYAGYRHSQPGGGYDTLIVTADELYNQFNYGEKSPLAIKTFLKIYHAKFQPDFLLLMGRAYGMYNTRRLGGVTYFYRNNPDIFPKQDLVPTYGYPYNDNRFSVGLKPTAPLGQDIAIGRVPAQTPEQVNDYLAKVKEKEAIGVSQPWQKEIVHLSGGLSAFELERYFSYVKGFEGIAEDLYLGGHVTTHRKRSNSSVEVINISEDINRGASLVTFFGHAAPSTTDIDIGFVSVNELGYDNKGKYPMLLLNGCDAGNSFGNAYTFGEDWILTPDRGASNFMAHANVGVDVYLRRYSESFYTKAFADSSLIYQPLGRIKLETEKRFYERYGTSVINQSHANQFILLGDPAIRLFPANHADYSLKQEEIFLKGFNGEQVNAQSDSLDLSIVVRNLGRVELDTVDLKVTRQLPDGTMIPYDPIKVPPIYYRDTLHFTVPNTGVANAGENFFTLEINGDKSLEEMSYMNNTVTVSKFIQSSGTLNLRPLDFAIHHQTEVEIISQVPGKAVEDRTLIFQLDTRADFSSATRKENRVTTNNLARWDADLSSLIGSKDTVTFYWRSKFLEPKMEKAPNGPKAALLILTMALKAGSKGNFRNWIKTSWIIWKPLIRKINGNIRTLS
ncbi:C25 family cysteine peptidase [Echinicola jeungdonensis]|uniref:putative type IX secretion system sortase PorU2 n=1 Tax=Echinicola jeungdonensis TaxID=709343 RepID=UPI0025B2BA17|nr:C25 family cysteine peptidase [Echinicola jeungdonensis]MDN3668438.1 C25 family cysteine peptidase [Echinicola jeungdonensis]